MHNHKHYNNAKTANNKR